MQATLTERDLTLRLDRARWWSIQNQPFYGSLAMNLVDQFADVETACTDGKVIKWGRDFLAGLTDEETRFVLLHEAMHPAHGHLWRLPADEKGNIAGDMQINRILCTIPGIKMPKVGVTCPPEFANLAEEEIYARLPDPPQRGQDGADPGGCGGFEEPAEGDGPGDDQANGNATGKPTDSLKDQWERNVIQAAQVAQATGQGSIPADMQRIIDRIKEQPINWRAEMADFVKSVVDTRNDWSRCARRHAGGRVIYPRKRVDSFGTVIFVRDTSGSIDGPILAEFSAHISTALADAGCSGILIDCDAEIQQEVKLAPGEECPLTAKGGGGTDFCSPLERAAQLIDEGERIAGLVYLTDLAGTFPDVASDYPTLWLSTTEAIAPFGRTVRIK